MKGFLLAAGLGTRLWPLSEVRAKPAFPFRGTPLIAHGVELMRRYEIQVLESYENITYADGQAASIYGQWPPLVNASRPQGEWNVYDIFFEAPRFEGDKVAKPGYVTVVHNGVLVHHRKEILGKAIHRRVASYAAHGAEEPLSLQDHGQTVRYRNIWIKELDLTNVDTDFKD